ncbi:MAG: single-stranded DNA-binding protein [Roseiflexaceae bacterium]
MATLIVYTNYTVRNADGSGRQESERHRVVVWGMHAEKAARLLTKGSKIRIQGRMTYPTWTDRKTGETRYGAEPASLVFSAARYIPLLSEQPLAPWSASAHKPLG